MSKHVDERMQNYLIANPPNTTASTNLTTNLTAYLNKATNGQRTAKWVALMVAAAGS